MDKKILLVKEVLARKNEIAEIEGSISTPLPIKEIYELKHFISSQNSHLGNKCLAFFGEITFKILYVDNNESCMRQVEQALPYRGFSFFKIPESLAHPAIKVHTQVQDIFAEKESSKSIKINGFLNLEIILFRERELQLGDSHCFELHSYDSDIDNTSQENNSRHHAPDLPLCEVPANNKTKCSKEIVTEVKEGIDQELTITID